jgi:hypothetical protein
MKDVRDRDEDRGDRERGDREREERREGEPRAADAERKGMLSCPNYDDLN